jgi:hypothetical protein
LAQTLPRLALSSGTRVVSTSVASANFNGTSSSEAAWAYRVVLPNRPRRPPPSAVWASVDFVAGWYWLIDITATSRLLARSGRAPSSV